MDSAAGHKDIRSLEGSWGYMNEPILGKRTHKHGYGYKKLTFAAYLKLRIAAQKVANAFGYPVYLVGSALYKKISRDIDIAIVMPLDNYERMFGVLPKSQDEYEKYLQGVFLKSWEHTKALHFCIKYDLDIKVCPDTWWPEKPKKLLARPKKHKLRDKLSA